MNDHDITATSSLPSATVQCRCGWIGTLAQHAIHFRAPEAAEGIAAARQALKGET